mmetsp:Transcript_8771/g.11644  ORF Transcript_8771/g.11644 Transcript_8771/m.11644 type:complete len:134 (-) Transcript_8771:219-620(-)|eukprot:CAMPEP_0198140610 /NCGR_PEP_ID=MMETSP1443-20131203/3754_1 /TAXON_ID=186043 /ORGANISM="Entomoneis sp., Strain CCMP2396" /LENGTH=133 /DNA_ID=CAMNT_0043803101 /DNA_START=127 /DNA_END=528 /DNA_ORIENTATION=-
MIHQTLCYMLFLLGSSSALVSTVSPTRTTAAASLVVLNGEGTGGWGIGNSREISPEEFSKGERRAFDGYQLSERSDFMRQVEKDAKQLIDDEMSELLGVASIAGLKMKDPSTRLNKFGDDLIDDDDDDLDLSV